MVGYALSRHPEIDQARIALIGWSSGDEVEQITGVLPNSGGLAISGQTSDPW